MHLFSHTVLGRMQSYLTEMIASTLQHSHWKNSRLKIMNRAGHVTAETKMIAIETKRWEWKWNYWIIGIRSESYQAIDLNKIPLPLAKSHTIERCVILIGCMARFWTDGRKSIFSLPFWTFQLYNTRRCNNFRSIIRRSP